MTAMSRVTSDATPLLQVLLHQPSYTCKQLLSAVTSRMQIVVTHGSCISKFNPKLTGTVDADSTLCCTCICHTVAARHSGTLFQATD